MEFTIENRGSSKRGYGEYKRRIVYIRPNKNATGQEKFKKYEVVYGGSGTLTTNFVSRSIMIIMANPVL